MKMYILIILGLCILTACSDGRGDKIEDTVITREHTLINEGLDSLISYENGQFLNFISLDGRTFKDGQKEFYPMVLNYSIDFISPDSGLDYFASPKSGSHPMYGIGEGESTSPWGYDSTSAHQMIDTHFGLIKDMGFNTIRLTGFTATDAHHGKFTTWGEMDISNGNYDMDTPSGNENIKDGIVPVIKTLLNYAKAHELRVILLISAVENQAQNQINYFERLSEDLADEKTLMAYDVYNEPLYFDRGDYTKEETNSFVSSYDNAIKKYAPHHMTTIGLSHYKIMHEWDCELLQVDFLAFHVYPYASKDLQNLEKFESKFYWISQVVSKPWIIGETGLNTDSLCDPINWSSGDYNHQREFMDYSMSLNRSSNSSGFAWWSFQDIKYTLDSAECPNTSCYGLLDLDRESTVRNSIGEEMPGSLKTEIADLPFRKFSMEYPYLDKSFTLLRMPEPKFYYNIDNLPTHKNITGRVIDTLGVGVGNAVITIYNHHTKTRYSSFSKIDGSFDVKTGWTNVLDAGDLEMVVSAVRMSTQIIPLDSSFLNSTVGDINLDYYFPQ